MLLFVLCKTSVTCVVQGAATLGRCLELRRLASFQLQTRKVQNKAPFAQQPAHRSSTLHKARPDDFDFIFSQACDRFPSLLLRTHNMKLS